jgi:ATP-dependent Lon protease
MAEFDYEMENTKNNRIHYATFIRKLCEEEGLKHFSKDGVARVVEYGVRLSDKQNKLSTQFNDLADIVREAHYWSKKGNTHIVESQHVSKAIEEKIKRINLTEEKIKESIIEEDILITIEGETIGQVNGLAVYNLGNISFGKPSRITAKTSVGKIGIINIEREAMMSGPIHNKGVMIISGFLKNMFAQDKPLAIDASIAFEQSYGGVDGDSASSTEIYAILSSLSDLPIKQYIAVTGSVNQNGEIQPIGGVNEKIEGFFDICRIKGLTGKQGVIIPVQNVDNLMLKKEILEAVKENMFHIYPIKTIHEGITLLTGVDCGKRDSEGKFPPGTVYFLVEHKLKSYANKFKEYGIG